MGVYTNMAANYVNNIGDNPVLESLQFSLDMQKADHAMFEALIELDFDEVYQEAGLSVYTEAEVKAGRKFSLRAIKNKVVEYIDRFIEAVKKFVTKVVAKLSDIFNKDKRLVKKFDERFKKNGSSCVFEDEVKVPKFNDIAKEMNRLGTGSITGGDTYETYQRFLNDIDKSETVEDANKKTEQYNNHINEAAKEIRGRNLDDYFTKKKGTLSGSELNQIQMHMDTGLQDSIKAIKANAKKLQDTLEKAKKPYLRTSAEEAEKTGEDGNVTVASAKAKGAISILSTFSSVVTVQRNFNINLIKATYAAVRKLYVACARAKEEKKSDESGESVNASYASGLATLSDMYIEEAFA